MDGNVVTMDMVTPPNAILSAFYKRSFANYTVKERMPRILTQIIDTLVRNKDQIGTEHGQEAKEELKSVIGELSKLKYEIQTNKAISAIKSNASDASYYNEYLLAHPNITYFTAVWLYTESYMYRRIQETCELSLHLQNFDFYGIQKKESFHSSYLAMEQLGSYLQTLHKTEEDFVKLLKLNLWGNKADLSFSGGIVEKTSDPFDSLKQLEPNILCDDSKQIWGAVCDSKLAQQIDVVLDNVGYELFTDLCLADYILTNGYADTINLYVKMFPYFISDATKQDLFWTLHELSKSDSAILRKLGERWLDYLKQQRIKIIEDDYWTTALDFTVMKTIKPQLYQKLTQSKLVIFKGDLNYRKLIGEKNWNPTVPFDFCLQGFRPTRLCTLRTIKCGIVCGLKDAVLDEIKVETEDGDWMVTGNYGVVQFADKLE